MSDDTPTRVETTPQRLSIGDFFTVANRLVVNLWLVQIGALLLGTACLVIGAGTAIEFVSIPLFLMPIVVPLQVAAAALKRSGVNPWKPYRVFGSDQVVEVSQGGEIVHRYSWTDFEGRDVILGLFGSLDTLTGTIVLGAALDQIVIVKRGCFTTIADAKSFDKLVERHLSVGGVVPRAFGKSI